MEFTCNQCNHKWEDPDLEGQPMVQCPECFAVIPMMLAVKAPAPAKEEPKPDVHEEQTVLETKPAPEPEPASPPAANIHEEQTVLETKPEPEPEIEELDDELDMGAGEEKTEILPGVGQPTAPPPPAAKDIHEENTVLMPGAKEEAAEEETLLQSPPTPTEEPVDAAEEETLLGSMDDVETLVPPSSEAETILESKPEVEDEGDEFDQTLPMAPKETDDDAPPIPPPSADWLEKTEPVSGDKTVRDDGLQPPSATPHEDLPPDFDPETINPSFSDDEVKSAPAATVLDQPEPEVTRPVAMPGPQEQAQAGADDATLPPAGDEETKVLAHEQPDPSATAETKPPAARTPTLPTGGGNDETVEQLPSAYKPAESDAPPAAKDFGGSTPATLNLEGKAVGGFRVKKMLGHGGMGAVFQARQLSLDRDVALKVLPGVLAKNPDFLMRFTREALSAAQLTHHNIIQVYDTGSQDNIHFISMEFVRGKDLGTMVRKDGRLSVDDAAGYVLQAARGLQYAHKHGIIHRDIKPDNLMVNEHGVVKIADMGLAKMIAAVEEATRLAPEDEEKILKQAKGDLTISDVAMGTPSYMAPEQGRDASTVGPKADQYSLGCTLYYLIAGRAPYSGSSAYEIISKHQMEPLPPLETHVKHVPPVLKTIILKMLEKDPEKRYESLEGAIADLEAYLGVESDKGAYRPREMHVKVLEAEQIAYNNVPGRKLRALVVPAFFAVMAILTVLFAISGSFLAGGTLALMVLTPLANFIINGITTGDSLFRRVRSVFFGMPFKGWLAAVGNAVLIVLLLSIFGLLWTWLGFAFVAVGLAFAYRAFVVRPLRKQRAPHIEAMQDMLKQLRLRGVSEEALQDFIARFSGRRWEEFFEDLFGYDLMILARAKVSRMEVKQKRKRYGVWRDPIAHWLDGIEDARRERREQKQLEKAEVRRLRSLGMGSKEAKAEAKKTANKLVKEGLLIPEIESEDVEEMKRMVKATRFRLPRKSIFNLGFQFLRLVAGAGMIAVYGLELFQIIDLPIPGFITDMALMDGTKIDLIVITLPFSPNYIGLVVGAFLFLSAFSSRIIAPFLVTAGAVLVVAREPFIAISGASLTEYQTVLVGAAVALLGFVYGILFRKR
ncbi:protein kinase [bacterium]|nr:protein kinase [bacterium]